MAYLAIDDQAADHPKLEALSDKAFRLWFKGISYSQRFLTDGEIPASVVPTLRGYSKATLDELLQPRPPFGPLWHQHDDGRIQIHDYGDWNRPREEVLHKRAAKKDRMKRWRSKSPSQSASQDAEQPVLRDAPRAPTLNHNLTVAKATGTAAPLIGRRNLRVLNDGDPVQFPSVLATEFQAVLRPKLRPDEDSYTALLAWVHRVSDRTVQEVGGAPKAVLEDPFGWWRARLAEDWSSANAAPKAKPCSRRHTPPCRDEVDCTRRYLDELAKPVEGRA